MPVRLLSATRLTEHKMKRGTSYGQRDALPKTVKVEAVEVLVVDHQRRPAGPLLSAPLSWPPSHTFSNINIPVVGVAWPFTVLNPEELECRLTSPYERILTPTVANIEHIDSSTVSAQAIVRIYLPPGASLDPANAQVTA